MSKITRTNWTHEQIENELRFISNAIGRFPTNSELQTMGRYDIANQISRKGGFVFWSQKLGFPRKRSDSDYGWEGEEQVRKLLTTLGFLVYPRHAVKSPFDIIINRTLRADIKTASFCKYGHSQGWFYRIGKEAQSDLVILWQSDTRNLYAIPWYICPRTNITITPTGSKYEQFKNNFQLIRQMAFIRCRESRQFQMPTLPARKFQ